MALVGAQFVNAVSPNPVGSLQAYAGASAPSGWLLCDGTSYSTSVYPELYSVLGYTYGGSGANFNVPDLRGRMPIGPNSDSTAANTATRSIGTKGGDTRMPTHNHGISDPGHTHTVPYNTGPDTLSGPHTGNYDPNTYGAPYTYTTSSRTTGVTVNNNGSGTAENMPPFLVTNYIIKAVPDAPRSGLAYGSTPPIVTALPSNPQFGDVVTYIADATNGVAWNLQYDASGTYPWKFIGGAPLVNEVTTSQSTTSTSNVDLTTVGPSLTLALAGDYVSTASVQVENNTSGSYCCYSIFVNGVATGAEMQARMGSASQTLPTFIDRNITGSAANSTVKLMYRAAVSGTANFVNRRLTITPVRVKAA